MYDISEWLDGRHDYSGEVVAMWKVLLFLGAVIIGSMVPSVYSGPIEWSAPSPFTDDDTNVTLPSGKKLGIGTNTSSNLIETHGTSNGEGIDVDGSAGNSNWLQFRENGTARGIIGNDDGGSIFSGNSADSLNIRAENSLHVGGGGNNIQITLDGSQVSILDNVVIEEDIAILLSVGGTKSGTSVGSGNGWLVWNDNGTDARSGLFFSDNAAHAASAWIEVQYVNTAGNYGDLQFVTRGADGSLPRLHVESDGKIGVGTTSPESDFHIPDGKYLQAEDFNAGAPPAADCDSDTERGRFSHDSSNNRLYFCAGATRGWDYASLTD